MATVAQLQQGISAFQDLAQALSDKLENIPADEAVVSDAVQLAVALDPALWPIATMLPVAEFIVVWIAQNNTQGRPQSQTPMAGGPPGSRIPPP